MRRTLSLVPFLAFAGCFQADPNDDEVGADTGTEDTGTDAESSSDEESSDTNSSTDDATTTEDTGDTDDDVDTTTEDTGDTSTDDTTDATDTTDTTTEDTTDGGCGPGEDECNGNCVDLSSDPDHCGECGHSCLGGTCTDSACDVLGLAEGKGRLFMVHVDPDYVYYGGDGVNIERVNKNGGGGVVLDVAAGSAEFAYDSALVPDALVWGSDWTGPGVRGCSTPNCAGGVTTMVNGTTMYGMVFNGSNSTLYYTQMGNNITQRVWPGGVANVFAGAETGPRDMTSDAANVYWVSNMAAADYHIRKKATNGNSVSNIVVDRTSMGAIVAGPSYIYWAEGATIYRAPLPNGGAAVQHGTSVNGSSVRKFTVDSTYVYWTVASANDGAVERCPLAGCAGAPTVIEMIPDPWGITNDAAAIYWVTENGQVRKVAKDY